MGRLGRLRSKLLLLAAGSVAPLLLLTFLLGYYVVEREQKTFRQATQDRNRTFLSAVDAKLQGHALSLELIAASPALASGDLRAFHAEASRRAATQPDWRNLVLADAAGQQIVNLRYPYGAALPKDRAEDSAALPALLAAGRWAIGDLGEGPAPGRPGIAVRVPVAIGGKPAYVLQAILKPDAVARLLAAQGYPTDWAVGLVDSHGRFIARLPYRAPGEQVSADLAGAMRRAADGWFRGLTLEGNDSYTAYRRSPLTGWTIAVTVPAATVQGAAWRAATYLSLAALLSLGVAALFAFWVARRITVPIGRVAQAARQLGHDAHPLLDEVRRQPQVAEVQELAEALEEGARAVAEREALRQREQAALRAADKAKDEFLAMLGHELRNPLSAITASAHVLRLSKPGAETALNAHTVIDRQARQMTRLVEDLLDVSRLAMGKVTLHPEHLELAPLIKHVVQTWQRAGRSRAARPVLCELTPCRVNADRARMEQVLANLLDNAEKFSPAGTPVRVRLGVAGEHALLEVQDEGQGIAAEELPHIFELFVQGQQTMDRPQGGIGLGLTLVKRLVELQGGSVSASSEGRGRGAMFTVRLPLASATADADSARAPRPAASLARRRVLLIEDNEDGRTIMESMLTLEGHEVFSAPNGEAGVRAAQMVQPEVVLVDIGLPDIDGYEVARRIRAMKFAHPPKLVAISGFGQPQDLRHAYEAGFDLHLTKPVAPEFLRDVIGALSSRQAAKL